MAIEQYTESLTLREMKCVLGDNDWGYVFPQGDVSSVDKVEKLLKKAGGSQSIAFLTIFRKVETVRRNPNTLSQ